MPGTVTDSRPTPDITSLAGSQQFSAVHHYGRNADIFPPSYRLIITTTKGVYAWDMNGVTELFRSGSEGIVAARKLSGNSEMLAVADSEVVVLHDINRGMQRSYRLKGAEVCAFMAPFRTILLTGTGPSETIEVCREFDEESLLYDDSAKFRPGILPQALQGTGSIG